MENTSNNSGAPDFIPMNCEDYKSIFTAGLEPYQILSFMVPLNSTVWTERDQTWMIVFYIYIAVLTLIFLKLGIVSIVMLIKKDCIRLPTKTFFAVYMSIAVLGFSRALWLALDPFGLVGFIVRPFPQWFIISRILEAFGFPSLVASYTLMIFTLLKVAKAVPGKQWYHHWKYIIPIILSPYIIAFGAEAIGNFAPYPALITVIICETFFTAWGITVCITFLVAGNRLLRQLRLRGRKTIRISTVRLSNSNRADMEQQMATRHEFASKEQQRRNIKTRRTTRKITIITYGTAVFTIIYSLLTAVGVIMISMLLYTSCLGYQGQQGLSSAWLALETSKRINEIVLAFVLLYSITDVTGVMKVLCGRCCMKDKRVTECDRHHNELNNLRNNTSSQMSMISRSERLYANSSAGSMDDIPDSEDFEPHSILVDDNLPTLTETHNAVSHIGTETDDIETTPITSPIQPQSPQQFLIIAQGDSASSIGSDSVSPSTSLSRGLPQTTFSTRTDDKHNTNEKDNISMTLTNATIGTQTVEIVDCACQTDPEPDQATRIKPIPKPRRFKPRMSRRKAANAQRQAAQRRPPVPFTNSLNHFTRKQTV